MVRTLTVLLTGLLLVWTPAARAADPPPAAPAAPAATPAAPANDGRADAALIAALPATVAGTTVGATREPTDPSTSCGCGGGSVWYRYVATTDGRVTVRLTAAGDLDALVDAFTLTRSQLSGSLAEQTTDAKGLASIGFAVTAGQTVLVRVARRENSVAGSFTVLFDAAAPPVRFPGPAIPRAGLTETLDAVLRPEGLVSARMVPGHAYRVAISPRTVLKKGGATVEACAVRLQLLAPGERGRPVKSIGCDGYFLFTPGQGQGGTYSIRTVVPAGTRGAQRYLLQVLPAEANDTAPGVFLGNHRRVRGALHGGTANRLDLYRFSVAQRSQLRLRLAGGKRLALILRTDQGRPVAAPGVGADIALNVPKGRYYVAVTAPAGAVGKYTLTRSTRVITRTRLVLPGHSRVGRPVAVGVLVRPAAIGVARITYERFDPIAGWLYAATDTVRIRRGRAATQFRPPAVGRYRARVAYLGSLDAAESTSTRGYLLVTDAT